MAARRRIASRRQWPDNLYMNGAGYYWYNNPATGIGYGLGRDYKVAASQARLANRALEERKGNLSLLQRIDGAGQTLAEWCDKYAEKHTADQKENTAKNTMSAIRAIKAAPCSTKSVAKVVPKDISDLLTDAIDNRGTAAAAKIRTVALDVFREAIEYGLIEPGKNPVESVFKPQHKVKRSRLTLDEFKLIVEEARADPTQRWAANAFELALLSAQRREDVKKMLFGDVKDGFLWVEQIKTGIKVRIPVAVRLDSIGLSLDDVIKRCRDDVVSKHIIHFVRHQGTTKPGHSPVLDRFSEVFATYRDQAKIKLPEGKTPPTFHEIRSLAARLYTAQYGKDFAQAILGHKSAATTELYRDVRGHEWTEVPMSAAQNSG